MTNPISRRYNNFKSGLQTTIEDVSIPAGASSNSLNWLTKGDHIELNRGRALLGITENAGVGRISGLHVAKRADGTEQPFRTHGRKVEYYDLTTLDWVEVGTNIIPAAGDGEDVSFADYNSTAGAQMFMNSPNGDYLKFMTANPGSYVSVYDSTKNFLGRISIKQNRTFLVGRPKDPSGIYGSYIDTLINTTVSAEVLGASGSTTYTGTLAFKSGDAKRTCYGIVITGTTGAGAETFTDDYNGVLTGSLGGTGTINYMSGAYSVTFNGVVTAGNVTADYSWEMSNNNGISDFTKSATRLAGQGFVFRQDDGGGAAQAIASYGDTEYCLHTLKTWALTLGATDTAATNLLFRHKVGIPNWRAAVETGDGIWYIDDQVESQPRIRLLTLNNVSTQVVPVEQSLNVDLSGFLFDKAAGIEWNDYILFACRTSDSEINNRVLAYNRVWKSFDILDTYVSCFAIFGGTLIVGDSLSNNVYTIFSGVDDDDSILNNYWEGWNGELELPGLKRNKRLVIEGNIGPDQEIEVFGSLDQGGYVSIGTIRGDGSYVDIGQSVAVGAVTIGRTEVGGGGTGLAAYHYVREFTQLSLDKFQRIKLKFVANALGYASVTDIWFKDIRFKGSKIPSKYR